MYVSSIQSILLKTAEHTHINLASTVLNVRKRIKLFQTSIIGAINKEKSSISSTKAAVWTDKIVMNSYVYTTK